MASRLMLRYKSQGFEQVYVSSLQDWKNLVSCDAKQLVVIDDMFGPTFLDSFRLNEWLSYLENIEKIVTERKGKLLVVCTSRKYIFEEVRSKISKFGLFTDLKLLDLTSRLLKLTTSEKENIFEKYAVEYGVEGFNKHEIGQLDPPHGFPHCVVLFCTDSILRQQNGILFFKNPVKCIQSEIRTFKETDPYKYLVLLLAVLSTIELRRSALETFCYEPTKTVEKIFRAAGVLLPTALPGIQNALDFLNGTYLDMGPDDCYHFSHEALAENVAAVLIDSNPVLSIEVVDFKYLLQHVSGEIPLNLTVRSYKSDVILRDSMLAPIVKRLTRELILGNLYTVSLCQLWCHKKFVNEWIIYIVTELDVEIDKVFNFQNENFNLLLFLTQFHREDAVMAILSNRIIRDRIRQWPKLLQAGLEHAFDSNCSAGLVRVFSTTCSEVFQTKLEGSRLLMSALENSNAEYAKELIKETKINPHFKNQYDRGFIYMLVRFQQNDGTFENLFELLTALGVPVNSKDILDESPLDFCIQKMHQDKKNKSAFVRLVLLVMAEKSICSNDMGSEVRKKLDIDPRNSPYFMLLRDLSGAPAVRHECFQQEWSRHGYVSTARPLRDLLFQMTFDEDYKNIFFCYPKETLVMSWAVLPDSFYFESWGIGIFHLIYDLSADDKEHNLCPVDPNHDPIYSYSFLKKYMYNKTELQKFSSALRQREKTVDLNDILCPGKPPISRHVISKSLEELNFHFDVIFEMHTMERTVTNILLIWARVYDL